MLQIRPARFTDAVLLAPRLRAEDAQEIRLVWSVAALEGLLFSLLNSDRACTLQVAGRPVALWGVTNAAVAGLSVGVPWMLASRALFQQRRALVSQSRTWVDRLLLDYDVLINVTDRSNTAHLRWLAWCGFRPLREHARFGPYQRPFQEFHRVNERRHPGAGALRALLLRRPAPQPLLLPVELRRLADELVRVLTSSAVAPPACLAAIDAADLLAWPPRWCRNVVALLVEAAQHLTRDATPAPPGDPWRCAAAVADTAEVARFAGADPPTLLVEMSRRIVRPSAAPAAVHQEPRPPSLLQPLGRYLDALTLGERVPPVVGLQLWEAALGVSGAAPVWGLPRAELHRALREHHLVAGWRTVITMRPLAGSQVLERLHAAWPHCPALRDALQQIVSEHPPSLPRTVPLRSVAALVGGLVELASRRLVAVPHVGAVSTGYSERHMLYRLLRASLLCTVGLPREAVAELLVAELSALLAVTAFEDALLASEPAGLAVRAQALAQALRRMWGGQSQEKPQVAELLPLLLPALICPAAATAQLPGALLAWHLLATATVDDVLQPVSAIFARQERAPRQRLVRCLREAIQELDMVTVQRHLDRHVHRHPTVAAADRAAAGPP